MKNFLRDKFEFEKRGTNFKTEIYAGLTTFLAMSYILVVNPNNILWGGTADPRFSSVFIATALGSFVGTLIMAFMANMPLAQAPGMGLNAIAGSILGGAFGFAFSYGNAMALIFLSGLFFLLISYLPGGHDPTTGKRVSMRETMYDSLPKPIRESISVGIGLFITFIGLQNAHLITNNDFTLVQLVQFNDPKLWAPGGDACCAVVCLFGLIVIGVLSHYKVKGSVIFGILLSTLLAIPLGVADLSILAGKVSGISWDFGNSLKEFFVSSNGEPVFLSIFRDGFNFPAGSLFTCCMLVISFSMIDMFDSIGTIVGCCSSAKLMDENGKPHNFGKIMSADSLSSIIGAVIGTSTITTFVESGTGVSVGGRTGVTSIVTALLFFLSIFILPLFAFIPTSAAACALIYVGVLMISQIKKVDFSHVKYAIPAFLTIVMMILTYSITSGIGLGVITFVLMDLSIYVVDFFKFVNNDFKGKVPKLEMNWVTFVVFILFLIYFLVPMGV